MKIILSRKGFDSANGRQANPIMPDGSLLSLPIPDKDGNIPYASLQWNGMNYYEIIHSLKPRTKLRAEDMCHLDPDLRKKVKERLPGWQPAFGQAGAALSHLYKLHVSVGDLFLFFGWFKATEERNGKLVYQKKAPEQHIIYGYMQIGSILEKKDNAPEWLKEHPHVADKKIRRDDLNAIFLPSNTLSFLPELKGCGILNYRPDRVLTKTGMSRGCWDLPSFFKKTEISYHPNPWKTDYFKSADRGQEFVMDATPEILDWAKQLLV